MNFVAPPNASDNNFSTRQKGQISFLKKGQDGNVHPPFGKAGYGPVYIPWDPHQRT